MAKYPVVLNAFDRNPVDIVFTGPSLTKQEFKDECDINVIMKRYEKDGFLAHFNKYQGQYGDFLDAPEFHEAQNKVLVATEMFMSLPAAIRSRFDNDPGAFLDFVGDPANGKELVELGLARAVDPDPAPPTPPAPPDPPPVPNK